MKKQKKKTSQTKLLVLTGILIVLALAAFWRPPNRDVPDQLLGEWRTTDVRYADRYFEITRTSISFTTGGGTVTTGEIKEIKTAPGGVRTLYTIVYDLEGARNEVSFFYETAKATGTIIRFKNQQEIVWVKDESI